jgi:hypothetical protein
MNCFEPGSLLQAAPPLPSSLAPDELPRAYLFTGLPRTIVLRGLPPPANEF